MLPVVVVQAFCVASVSAAALTLHVQSPLDILFGSKPWKEYPEPHPNPQKTIYETLVADGRFTYLTKALEFVGDEIKNVLNNNSYPVTFFAVPDTALHHGHDHDEDRREYRHIFDMALASDRDFHQRDAASLFEGTIPDLASVLTSFDALMDDPKKDLDEEDPQPDPPHHDDPEDPDKERRKRVVRFFINFILQYHTLPARVSVEDLQFNATYPVHLQIPAAFGGQHQRVRVSHKYKKRKTDTFLNEFSKIEIGDIEASNGLIHVVNHPIMPPGPIFAELFQFQKFFSIFTSALQRTGLADDVDLRYVFDKQDDHGHFEGTSAATAFAVPNKVFLKLPERLQRYLFSPFGHRALRKLLSYHIAPGVIAYSDYFFNKTAETNPLEPVERCTCGRHADLLKKHHETEVISRSHHLLDTLLPHRTVHWDSEKIRISFPRKYKRPDRYKAHVLVNGENVKMFDIPAINGALHIIEKFLVPWHCEHGHRHLYAADGNDEIWENWEEWLPQLAAEDEA